jgi:hypothetical protein
MSCLQNSLFLTYTSLEIEIGGEERLVSYYYLIWLKLLSFRDRNSKKIPLLLFPFILDIRVFVLIFTFMLSVRVFEIIGFFDIEISIFRYFEI